MEQIIVKSSISVHSFGILAICFFVVVIVYLAITTRLTEEETKKIKRAKFLISEGHERAINGRKNDGYYEEVKKLRNPEETDNTGVQEENKEDDVEVVQDEEI